MANMHEFSKQQQKKLKDFERRLKNVNSKAEFDNITSELETIILNNDKFGTNEHKLAEAKYNLVQIELSKRLKIRSEFFTNSGNGMDKAFDEMMKAFVSNGIDSKPHTDMEMFEFMRPFLEPIMNQYRINE